MKIEFQNREIKHSHDWVCGQRERHCRAALASFDSFVSFSYQEENESPAGEAKNKLKNYYQFLHQKTIFRNATI